MKVKTKGKQVPTEFYPKDNYWDEKIIIPKIGDMVWIEFNNGTPNEEVGIVKIDRVYVEYDPSSRSNLVLIKYTPITYKFSGRVIVDTAGRATINCYFIRSMFPSNEQFKKSGHNKTDILKLLRSSDKDSVKLGFAIIEELIKQRDINQ